MEGCKKIGNYFMSVCFYGCTKLNFAGIEPIDGNAIEEIGKEYLRSAFSYIRNINFKPMVEVEKPNLKNVGIYYMADMYVDTTLAYLGTEVALPIDASVSSYFRQNMYGCSTYSPQDDRGEQIKSYIHAEDFAKRAKLYFSYDRYFSCSSTSQSVDWPRYWTDASHTETKPVYEATSLTDKDYLKGWTNLPNKDDYPLWT
jgi:hypothetical protein